MSKYRASVLVVAAILVGGCSDGPGPRADWDDTERALLRSLSLAALPALPESVGNRFADDAGAAALGHRWFFDPALSANGAVSCATCHRPELHFSDGRARSVGVGAGARNSPSVVGAGYLPWLFWDGRRDSLWSQALAPLEAGNEMGSTRMQVARHALADAAAYQAVFGEVPDLADRERFPEVASPYGSSEARANWGRMAEADRRTVDRVFANVGKALEAYQRRLAPEPTRFDVYVEWLSGSAAAQPMLGTDEIAGLRLFIDAERTRCLRCHNGPLLTNHGFHDIATSRLGPVPDLGRFAGVQSVLLDPFNCLGAYSDAAAERCVGLRFLERREIARFAGAFKVPSLRGVGDTAPYFHHGGVASLEAVVAHYRNPPEDPGSELDPVELTDQEAARIAAFLRALSPVSHSTSPWRRAPAESRRENDPG